MFFPKQTQVDIDDNRIATYILLVPEPDENATKGAKKFHAYIMGDNPTGNPVPIRVVAAAIGVTDRTIDRWCEGAYSPDQGSRCVIEGWTDGRVKVEWWETEEEKRRIRQANEITPYGTEPRKKRTSR